MKSLISLIAMAVATVSLAGPSQAQDANSAPHSLASPKQVLSPAKDGARTRFGKLQSDLPKHTAWQVVSITNKDGLYLVGLSAGSGKKKITVELPATREQAEAAKLAVGDEVTLASRTRDKLSVLVLSKGAAPIAAVGPELGGLAGGR